MHQRITSSVPDALVARLHAHAHVGVLTGAGVSAPSGIPTFRGNDGLWKRHRAEDLATPQAFARDPATVWEWYGWRRDRVREAAPNPAHFALAQLAEHVASVSIITQNVDGLHQRARGDAAAAELIELHGSLWAFACTDCGNEAENHAPGPAPGVLPRCSCGGLQRPGVVWFGESLSEERLGRALTIATECDVFLVVGTSGIVVPAATLGRVAAARGAYVAEFNLDCSRSASHVHAAIEGPCETSLPALLATLTDRKAS